MTSDAEQPTRRLPRYSNRRVVEYTRNGPRGDQELLEVVRDKTVEVGTLTGEGTTVRTHPQTLADLPASYAWEVMQALADYFNCEVVKE